MLDHQGVCSSLSLPSFNGLCYLHSNLQHSQPPPTSLLWSGASQKPLGRNTMFEFHKDTECQRLSLMQVLLSSWALCLGKELPCAPLSQTQVCILHFSYMSTCAGNQCRVLQKAFDKDWSGTGMERQRLLKKGETAPRNWFLPVQILPTQKQQQENINCLTSVTGKQSCLPWRATAQ